MYRPATLLSVVLLWSASAVVLAEVTSPADYAATKVGDLEGHATAVRMLEVNRTGRVCISVDDDNQVILWDLRSRRAVKRITEGLPAPIKRLALSANGRIMVVAGDNTAVQVWDLKTGTKTKEFPVEKQPVTDVAVLGNGTFVAACDSAGHVYRWPLQGEEGADKFDIKHQAAIWAVSADHQTLYFASSSASTVLVWKLGDEQPRKVNVGGYQMDGAVVLFNVTDRMPTVVSDDQRYIATETTMGLRITQDPAVAGDFFQRPEGSKYGHGLHVFSFSPGGGFFVLYGGADSYQVRQSDMNALHINAGPQSPKNVKCLKLWLGTRAEDDWLGLSGRNDGRIEVWKLEKPKEGLLPSKTVLARKVYDALSDEKFEDLEALVNAARESDDPFYYDGHHQLQIFYNAAMIGQEEMSTEKKLERVAKWKAAHPESSAALITEASLWNAYAWAARGTGFANTVTEEGWKLFRERTKKAREALDKAEEMGPDPELYRLKIDFAKTDPQDPEEIMKAVAASIEVNPMYHPIYESVVEYLLPRWHGQPGDVKRFAEGIADRVGGTDGDELYARMVHRGFNYERELVFAKLDLDYQRYKRGIAQLRKRYPMSDLFVSWQIRLAHAGNDKEHCLELIEKLDNRLHPAVFSSGGQVGQIHQWAKTKPDPYLVYRLRGHRREVWGIGWLTDDRELVTLGGDGELKRWDPRAGQLIDTRKSSNGNQGVKMAVAADGNSLLVAYRGHSRRKAYVEYFRYRERAGLVPAGSSETVETVRDLAISANGNTMTAAFRGGRAAIYTTSSNSTKLNPVEFQDAKEIKFSSVDVTRNGETIWTGGSKLRLWKPDGELIKEMDESGAPHLDSADKQLILMRGKNPHFFTVDPWETRGNLEFDFQTMDLQFSRDSKLLAIGLVGGAALVSAHDGSLVHFFEDAQIGFALAVAFSHDGKRLAAGGSGGNVNIWDIEELAKKTEARLKEQEKDQAPPEQEPAEKEAPAEEEQE